MRTASERGYFNAMSDQQSGGFKFLDIQELVESIPNYFHTIKRIATRRGRFAKELEDRRLSVSLLFLSVGFALTFALMTPAFLASDHAVSKYVFVVRLFIMFAAQTIVLHLLLRVFGAKRRLKQTFIVYAHLEGMFIPLCILLVYPTLVIAGPLALFGETAEITKDTTLLLNHAIWFLCSYIALWAALVYEIVIGSAWFAESHHVGRQYCALSLSLLLVIQTALVPFVVNPFLNKWLEKWLELWK
jgi:hypothetical protein